MWTEGTVRILKVRPRKGLLGALEIDRVGNRNSKENISFSTYLLCSDFEDIFCYPGNRARTSVQR